MLLNLQQLGNRNAEGFCDFMKGSEGEIPITILNSLVVLVIETEFGHLLLRQAPINSQLPDALPHQFE